MAVPIRMPDLGTTVEEFRIMRWLIAEGDPVAIGDELVEIETDKAVTALESTAAGTVLRHLVAEEDVAHTGDILAYVGAPGDAIPDAAPPVVVPAPVVVPTPLRAATPQVAPVVRNLAAKLGVELATLHGTGANGMIIREDVLRAAQATPADQTLSRNQAAVARAVGASWSEIPHTFFTAEIDMTAAQALRAHSKADGAPISYDAMFLAALARAVAAMPHFTLRLDGERLLPSGGIHLALAVEVNGELLLPVLRDADRLALPALQAEIDRLLRLIADHSLPAANLAGGCLALTNLGMYPLASFDPIIFPGHSAMLALGAIRATPVAQAGAVVIRPLLQATLAVDHRLINGRAAAALLTAIKRHIEEEIS